MYCTRESMPEERREVISKPRITSRVQGCGQPWNVVQPSCTCWDLWMFLKEKKRDMIKGDKKPFKDQKS